MGFDQVARPNNRPGLEIPKTPFLRLVREVVDEFKPDIRFTDQALEALHRAAGAMLFYAVVSAPVWVRLTGSCMMRNQSLQTQSGLSSSQGIINWQRG
jgi:hypothetical protein